MPQRFSPIFLRLLRNRISIDTLITSTLNIPFKYSENYLRFLCPLCGDFHTATNPKTNLARCFRCQKNFNPIDMVMIVKNFSFVQAVGFLKSLLHSQTPNPGIQTGQEDKVDPQKTSPATSNRVPSGLGGVRLKEKKTGRDKTSCETYCERKVPFI